MRESSERINKPLYLRIWFKYKSLVENTIRGSVQIELEDIAYWRERLFIKFIIYMLPVCLIALVPGVLMALKDGYIVIAVFDLVAAISIGVITLTGKLKLAYRKAFVICMLYALAIILLLYLGSFGPGVIYLFALSVFVALFYSQYYAYWSIAFNLLICICCALIIDLKLFDSPLATEYDLGVWTAVSSNLIFLSWISVVLISKAIKGLESTIAKEFQLTAELGKETIKGIQSGKQIVESEGHYKSLFFLNPSPMWVLDSESLRFLQVNDAAIKQYGYSNDEFLSMTINDMKLEKDGEAVRELLQKTSKTAPPANIITQHRRKNQERFYVDVRFTYILFKGKQATLAVARDITEQMNHIEEIKAQNKQLLEIAYMQSHLVRAPLAKIMGLVNLISESKDEKTDTEMLSYLADSATELDEVIRLITTSAESGRSGENKKI